MKRLLLVSLLVAGCHAPSTGPTTTTSAAPSSSAPTVARDRETPAAEVQPTTEDAARTIELQGAKNVRDLGGLQGTKPIPKDRIIRTADLSKMTDADRSTLAAHGVKLDVDLRTPAEVERAPDPLAKDPRFTYVNISLLGDAPLNLEQFPTLGALYVRALSENQPQWKRVFQTLAAQGDGAVLYHCTAGKDRTGMVTAILLELAGVDRDAIIHNYAISASYLHEQTRDFVARNPKIAHIAGTPPVAMATFLDTLDTQYGGARAFLVKVGITDAEIRALSRRLGQST